VAYVLCRLFGLTQTYPAVLTAIIVMQGSVGASLKAMVDRFVGSLGGAVWAVAVLLALQHFKSIQYGDGARGCAGAAGVAGRFQAGISRAPTAAIILLLTPSTAPGRWAPAIQRMLEIGLGSVVALVVALLVLPARAMARSQRQPVVR